MLLIITWILFWKLYVLAVICLIVIPVARDLRNRVERYPAAQPSAEQPGDQVREHSNSRSEICTDYIVPPHLKIWEPETPPVIKAKVNAQDHPNRNKDNGKVKVHETCPSKKQIVQVKSNIRERPSEKNKVFRRGLRRIAAELAACLNGVAENTTTERELYKAVRLVIRQHPGLQNLPYGDALQALMWMEGDFASLTVISLTDAEGC